MKRLNALTGMSEIFKRKFSIKETDSCLIDIRYFR